MSNFVNLLDIVYPVGSIYHSMNTTSPADFVGGTWTKIKTFLYGADVANQTGGEAEHTLTIDEMPKHNHRTINQNCIFNAIDAKRITVASGSTATFSQSYFTVTDAGGGQHTTTCRPTRPASFGTEQLKAKRGGVCLITLTSWILSTPLGQYFSRTVRLHQQAQLVEHGQNLTTTRSFVAAHRTQLAAQTRLGLQLMKCRHIITNLLDMANGLAAIHKIISKLHLMVEEIGTHQWIQWKALAVINHLIIAQNTEHLTSISAQLNLFEGNFMFPSFFYGQIPKIKHKLFSYYIRLCREEGILPRMDALSQLVSQYSFGAIVMLVVTLAVAFKFLSELLEYFYGKLQKFFNYQTLKDKKHSEIVESIALLQADIKNLSQEISNQSNDIKALKEHEKLTLERLQENSRSYIIDKHHYFCYEIKAIDDLNLESLERRYLYYKAAGGNSFIDGLMEEIRDLPRINLSNPQFVISQKNNERSE